MKTNPSDLDPEVQREVQALSAPERRRMVRCLRAWIAYAKALDQQAGPRLGAGFSRPPNRWN